MRKFQLISKPVKLIKARGSRSLLKVLIAELDFSAEKQQTWSGVKVSHRFPPVGRQSGSCRQSVEMKLQKPAATLTLAKTHSWSAEEVSPTEFYYKNRNQMWFSADLKITRQEKEIRKRLKCVFLFILTQRGSHRKVWAENRSSPVHHFFQH